MKMKNLILVLTFSIISSSAFAGAYSLRCISADKSLVLEWGTAKLTTDQGQVLEAEYHAA